MRSERERAAPTGRRETVYQAPRVHATEYPGLCGRARGRGLGSSPHTIHPYMDMYMLCMCMCNPICACSVPFAQKLCVQSSPHTPVRLTFLHSVEFLKPCKSAPTPGGPNPLPTQVFHRHPEKFTAQRRGVGR